MNFINICTRVGIVAVACVFVIACRRGPTPIPSTRINAKKAAAKALELYDQDGDSALSDAEMSPGLRYAAKRADSNADGSLDATELRSMVDAWNKKSIGLLTLRCNVKYNRRPLAGAEVTLVPDPFLEGQIEAADGITDEYGDTYLSVPKEKRPIADAPPGVQLGLYQVVVSKRKGEKESIPAKFNTETELGQEVSFDDPGVLNGITYDLKR
jgi:hypothetical protein